MSPDAIRGKARQVAEALLPYVSHQPWCKANDGLVEECNCGLHAHLDGFGVEWEDRDWLIEAAEAKTGRGWDVGRS